MKLLLDMNLTPMWVGFLQENGFEAVRWSAVGNLTAMDVTLMDWARRDGSVVFTTDLDFSAILAAAQATGPSVLQLRARDVLPASIGANVIRVLREHADHCRRGAIISFDGVRARVRILPIRRS